MTYFSQISSYQLIQYGISHNIKSTWLFWRMKCPNEQMSNDPEIQDGCLEYESRFCILPRKCGQYNNHTWTDGHHIVSSTRGILSLYVVISLGYVKKYHISPKKRACLSKHAPRLLLFVWP